MDRGPGPTRPRSFGRALVTGGAGFVGSHLCEALLAAGTEVVCVDDFSTGRPGNVAHLRDDPGFALVEHDVAAGLDGVTGARPVDLVLHLASPASPVDYLRLPLQTLDAGSLGTRHALGLAREHGARFVLASTSEVYGDPAVHPQPEDYWGNVNPVGPRSVYDESKRFAEAQTAAWRRATGLDAGIVRIFNTYGPRMRSDDGRMVPTFVEQALAGGPVTVAGDGSQTRSLCHVSDLVRGILAFAERGGAGPVNLGTDEERSVLRVAMDVVAAVGSGASVTFVDLPTDDPRRRRPDLGRAERELGWRPRTSWADGLRDTVAWFREAGARQGQDASPEAITSSSRISHPAG